MSADPRIPPTSLPDLKNTTDDALGNYLRGLGFQQDHHKLDVRLGVGYASVAIAAAIFAADYRLGWDATKGWTLVAVVAYFVLSCIGQYWTWFVEKGVVFEGNRGGKHLAIASKTNKHDPTYYLTVTVSRAGAVGVGGGGGGGGGVGKGESSSTQESRIQAPFTTWFTADGYFVAQPFQQWLASSVGPVGDADVKNSGREELVAATAAASASGVDSTTSTTIKKSKKKA